MDHNSPAATPAAADDAVVVDALGTPVALRVPPDAVERVRAQWSRCLTSAAAAHVLDLRGEPDLNVREYHATSQATLLGLQAVVGPRVNLHGAGVADPSGAVVALVGASGMGKTTAAAELGRSYGYVTDECVSVAPGDLAVLPYPKPLSLVINPSEPLHKRQCGPDELGLRVAPPALRLSAVVILHRSAEPLPPRLVPVPTSEALMELVPQISGLRHTAAPLTTVAGLLARTGGAARLEYHDIADAVGLVAACLRDRLAAYAPPPPAGAAAPGPGPGPPRRPADILIRRQPWVEWVDTGGGLVVFDGDRTYLLQGVGRAVWLLTEEPGTPRELARGVSELLGRHPRGRRLVQEAVSVMAGAGVLEVVTSQGDG